MSSCDESDDEMIMLEDIRDGIQSHPSVNRRAACYNIPDHIKRGQEEWKWVLLSMRSMGKGLHKIFKAFFYDISLALPMLGESGSEVYYFIPKPRNFS